MDKLFDLIQYHANRVFDECAAEEFLITVEEAREEWRDLVREVSKQRPENDS